MAETDFTKTMKESGQTEPQAESSLVVEGFRFLTTADAEKAKLDLAKINYLKKKFLVFLNQKVS